MKILTASDLHGDITAARRLADQAKNEDVNLVILCGDLGNWGQDPSKIIEEFVKRDKKVLLIPGNHDTVATTDFLAEFFGVKNIHGYSVKYEDVGIFGCGGADFGLTSLTEKEIFDTLKKGYDKIAYLKKKIMVTHMHPSRSKAEFSGFKGSKAIAEAVKKFKPDLLLCGHIHEAEGIEDKIDKTLVLNVGKKGKVVEI